MLKAESKWQIGAMKLFLKANSERGDEFFDNTQEVILGLAQGLPQYPRFQEQGPDKQTEIRLGLFATYVGEELSKFTVETLRLYLCNRL